MIFDKREAACSEYLIVSSRDTPVEVGQSELVVFYGAVGDTEGGPGGQTPLREVAVQHL